MADLRSCAAARAARRDDVVRRHARRLRVRITPDSARSERASCSRTSGANVVDQLLGSGSRSWPGRLAVAAAAERAGDPRHVDAAVGRAQADLAPVASSQQLAHEHRDLGVLDRAQVVDDALGVRLDRAGLAEVARVRWATVTRAVVVALDRRQRARQQLQARERQVLVSWR